MKAAGEEEYLAFDLLASGKSCGDQSTAVREAYERWSGVASATDVRYPFEFVLRRCALLQHGGLNNDEIRPD